jgi:hypothetical protein
MRRAVGCLLAAVAVLAVSAGCAGKPSAPVRAPVPAATLYPDGSAFSTAAIVDGITLEVRAQRSRSATLNVAFRVLGTHAQVVEEMPGLVATAETSGGVVTLYAENDAEDTPSGSQDRFTERSSVFVAAIPANAAWIVVRANVHPAGKLAAGPAVRFPVRSVPTVRSLGGIAFSVPASSAVIGY